MYKYIKILIKSPFIRARILSAVRAGVTSVGGILLAKGYVDESFVTGSAGLIAGLVGFWLGDLDVKQVDKKIEAAIKLDPVIVQTKTQDEIEREITKGLNLGKIGKAGW